MTEADVVAALRSSRKYSGLSEETLLRVARWSNSRYQKPKRIVKGAKRKLHQIFGAYVENFDVASAAELVEAMPSDTDLLRKVCRKILSMHASTRERLPILENVYRDLFLITGKPRSLLDAACGLNPFSLPWMELTPQCRYSACDADGGLITLITSFFRQLDANHRAFQMDIIASPPPEAYDVVLLLKLLPCLEQQERGSSLRLLASLKSRRYVVSFPRRSLSGRRGGLERTHESLLQNIAQKLETKVDRLSYAGEAFYVLSR